MVKRELRKLEHFLFNRKVLQTSLLNKKRSAKDRTTADRKMSLKRPAVGGESCRKVF